MRILTVVILSLIIAHPDRVLGVKRGKVKQKNNEGPCGKRYLRKLHNKCYYFSMKKMNWFGAQNNCLRKGLNLADLSTTEDYNAVLHYMRAIGNMEDYWFGGNDLQTEGQFTYISNGGMVRFMGDNTGGLLPTHRSNLDDCLEVRLRENNTIITDDNCQERQYFVCENNALECATAASPAESATKHSHEHLHHFHHNPSTGNENGNKNESVDTDSRPADNSNSTEVGTSEESEDESSTDSDESSSSEETEESFEQTPDSNTNTTQGSPSTVETTQSSQGTVETTQSSQSPYDTTEGSQNPDETTTGIPTESSTLEGGETTVTGESTISSDAEEETTTSEGAESASPGEEETTENTEGPLSERPPYEADVTKVVPATTSPQTMHIKSTTSS